MHIISDPLICILYYLIWSKGFVIFQDEGKNMKNMKYCYLQLPFFHKIEEQIDLIVLKFPARKKQADKLKKMSSTKADSVETNSVDDDGKDKFTN